MTDSPRVLLAGLFHETHTFLAEQTTLADFEIRSGNELLAAAGDGSPLAAVVEFGQQAGWNLIPTIDYRAMPSGTVNNEVFEQFWSKFESNWQSDVEGVYLVLHGAMATDRFPDVEGELLKRIRQLPGAEQLPVCGVLDLHGNISTQMMQLSQGFVSYQKNPHTDAHAAATQGAKLLDRILTTGQLPTVLHEPAGLLWPPTAVGTDDDPMKTLEELARQTEEDVEGIHTVNIFAGYSFADTPATGVSISVITFGAPDNAQAKLNEIKQWALDNRHLASVVEHQPEELISQIKKHIQEDETPVILAEPSDNIGGGAPGDGTSLLRFFMKHDIQESVVIINDPEAVNQLETVDLGESCTLSVGGKGSHLAEGPVEVTATLMNKTDGRFVLEDRNSHLASLAGVHIEMGKCAVLKQTAVTILLTSQKTPPFDLGQLRSQGIIPEEASVLGVKAAVAHRQAYNPIAAKNYTVETPGPCSSNVTSFPYEKISRPLFPLDEIGA